jgi:hypothetical protein
LEAITFPSEPTFLKGSHEGSEVRFVIVQTKVVTSLNTRRIENLSFQVGMKRKADKDWTYVDGRRLDKLRREQFLPGFPADHELPERSRKTL